MSVAGFDLGDQASCVAVARKRGIDVLLNKESKRECPSVVSFGPKQRQLGTDAAGSLAINPKNAVTQLKRLLGKRFSSPDVQNDIMKLPFVVKEGPGGGLLVDVQYLNEKVSITPEQLVAMLMVDLKSIAEADGSPVTDCVIGVPTFFTEAERLAMLGAAHIAGVNCLRLINENTATALAFGIYKADLPDSEPINVAFVDIGHAAMQVIKQIYGSLSLRSETIRKHKVPPSYNCHCRVLKPGSAPASAKALAPETAACSVLLWSSMAILLRHLTLLVSRYQLLPSRRASCKCWPMLGIATLVGGTLMRSCLSISAQSSQRSTKSTSSPMPEQASACVWPARR